MLPKSGPPVPLLPMCPVFCLVHLLCHPTYVPGVEAKLVMARMGSNMVGGWRGAPISIANKCVEVERKVIGVPFMLEHLDVAPTQTLAALVPTSLVLDGEGVLPCQPPLAFGGAVALVMLPLLLELLPGSWWCAMLQQPIHEL